MAIPRYRTVKQAVEELKQADEKSAVTEYYIRGLVLSGKLPYMAVGRKKLIDLNVLIDYLSNPVKPAEEPQNTFTADGLNHIRKLG